MDSHVSDADLAAGRRLMARLEAFADFTDEPRRLTRLFLSEAHRRAAHAFMGWCSEAGLRASDARPRPRAPQGDGAGTGSMSNPQNEKEDAWPVSEPNSDAPLPQ